MPLTGSVSAPGLTCCRWPGRSVTRNDPSGRSATDHGTSKGPAIRSATGSGPSASTSPVSSSGPVVQVFDVGQRTLSCDQSVAGRIGTIKKAITTAQSLSYRMQSPVSAVLSVGDGVEQREGRQGRVVV